MKIEISATTRSNVGDCADCKPDINEMRPRPDRDVLNVVIETRGGSYSFRVCNDHCEAFATALEEAARRIRCGTTFML